MPTYRTDFELLYPVTNEDLAQNFLDEQNPLDKLLQAFPELEGKIIDHRWVITDEDKGYMEVKTKGKIVLSEDQLDDISDWICDEASQGIGAEFETQSFAYYKEVDEFDYDDDSSSGRGGKKSSSGSRKSKSGSDGWGYGYDDYDDDDDGWGDDDDDYYDLDDGWDDPDEEDYVSASFNWEDSDYRLELVG